MTSELRERLRRAIDESARAAIDWAADARCGGCGCELRDPVSGRSRYVAGCKTCADRASKRRQREAA